MAAAAFFAARNEDLLADRPQLLSHQETSVRVIERPRRNKTSICACNYSMSVSIIKKRFRGASSLD